MLFTQRWKWSQFPTRCGFDKLFTMYEVWNNSFEQGIDVPARLMIKFVYCLLFLL
jgi:hypothetical protein